MSVGNRISVVMLTVLASSEADYGCKPWSGLFIFYKICICFFSAKHATLRSKNKKTGGLRIGIMCEASGAKSSNGRLCKLASTVKIPLSVLILYICTKGDIIIVSSKCNLFAPWYSWTIAHLELNNNHSFCLISSVSYDEWRIKTVFIIYS